MIYKVNYSKLFKDRNKRKDWGGSMNILSIIVVAVVYMALGMFWYNPNVFGKKWMMLLGKKRQDMKKQNMTPLHIMAFIAALVITLILAVFIRFSNASSIGEGALIGLLVWAGFVATFALNDVLWKGEPFGLYILNNGYYLIALVIMGAILAVW